MARYLTATLFCEGREDARFLENVLERQLIAFGLSGPGFEMGVVVPQLCRTVDHATRVDEAVRAAALHFDLVFVHHDWNERGKIEALGKRLAAELTSASRLVGVVPVRETEAWPLADQASFPRSRVKSPVLDLVRPRDVEAIPDPKALLEETLGRPYDERVAEWIGERIDLGHLALVPAYARFLNDLMTALKELHFL